MVKIIQEKRLREALLLTWFESLGVTVTVGSKQVWFKRVSPKDMYVWGVNQTATKHTDYIVCKDTPKRVTRRCDDAVDKKRMNSCVLKYFFCQWREVSTQKNRPKTPEMLSQTRY